MDINLKDHFFSDAKEFLEKIEENLLILEKENDNKAVIDDTFRFFHTLKGNSGLAEVDSINKVCHETETLLDMIRKGDLTFDEENLSLFLSSVDLMKKIVYSEDSDEYEFEVYSLIETLETYRKNIRENQTKVTSNNNNFIVEINDLKILKQIALNCCEIKKIYENFKIDYNYNINIIINLITSLKTIVPEKTKISFILKYLKGVLKLIKKCNVTYNKDGFEILTVIISDLEKEINYNIRNSNKIIRIPMNSIKELVIFYDEEKVDNNNKIILELRILDDEVNCFEVNELFLILDNIYKKYDKNISFIALFNKNIIDKYNIVKDIEGYDYKIYENFMELICDI